MRTLKDILGTILICIVCFYAYGTLLAMILLPIITVAVGIAAMLGLIQ